MIAELMVAYVLAATLLTITPGIDTALILRTSTVQGTRTALTAAAGIGLGCLAWGAMVAFGLGALIAASELAYSILKWCGAAYLCWLGVQMLLKPRNHFSGDNATSTKQQNWFMRGFLGNLLNPKVGIFYVSFLPQFIPAGKDVVMWTFLLVGIHVILGIIWSGLLIGATRPLSTLFKKPAVIRWMDRTTGLIFIMFAAKLAFSRR